MFSDDSRPGSPTKILALYYSPRLLGASLLPLTILSRRSSSVTKSIHRKPATINQQAYPPLKSSNHSPRNISQRSFLLSLRPSSSPNRSQNPTFLSQVLFHSALKPTRKEANQSTGEKARRKNDVLPCLIGSNSAVLLRCGYGSGDSD